MFAHDTSDALVGVAALVNREFDDVDQLAEFYATQRWTGRHTGESAELAAVKALQPRLRRLWEVDADAAVPIVNGILAEADALPQLTRHGEYGWHIHASPPDAPLQVRMAVEGAMAMIDVIRTDEWDRLRLCAAEDCDNVLIDLTRNRSKRFCDEGCGNRVAAAAYRERRRER